MELRIFIALAITLILIALFSDTVFNAIRTWASGTRADAAFDEWEKAPEESSSAKK